MDPSIRDEVSRISVLLTGMLTGKKTILTIKPANKIIVIAAEIIK
jgi:hypothetical protein